MTPTRSTLIPYVKEIIVPKMDVLAWLSTQEIYPKFYWKDKMSKVERAALGSVEDFFHIPENIDGKARLYGGHFFCLENRAPPLWEDFPPCYFFLPSFEIEQDENVCKMIIRSFESISTHDALTSLTFLYSSIEIEDLLYQGRADLPSKERWIVSIRAALKKMEEGTIEKVVLARQTTLDCSTSISPYSLLQKLQTEPSYPTTQFLYQVTPHSAFIGSTPEMLYHRIGSHIETEAIAGTRKRGSCKEEDALLQNDLLNHSKESSEFAYVNDFLSRTLSSLCSEYSCSQSPSIIQTATVQHLHIKFSGTLLPNVTDSLLLSSLHPTPALGGVPRAPSLDYIRFLEQFTRGLYGGPIGWLSKNESQVAVSIRSALVQKNLLHVFAGTGLVHGSDPEKEWEELEHKIAQWKPIHAS